ncbi:ABC transporter ATP-binding protein [Pusillimonas sp. T2]|uniref:ABC transporter ATP-binding protein n=1 Tax=Pusillimonas sp. T2 TaxID=1548123 RepID=UPI000B8B7A1B|nr:ABC transporter ATP-binding protein [Pusillimonas sp. T2]OXR48070.1 ABC transporter ATP-binding protein [Pusillimonas sp. T2]
MTNAMLEVKEIESFYDKSQALFGMSFSVRQGEFCTLIGRNGMGKTTTVKSIMGLLNPARGQVLFEGKPLHKLPPYQVARFGLGLVPEGRQIFTNLTVRENLTATARDAGGSDSKWTLERIFQLFPSLERRAKNLGSNLSGGEQQMLAIGRALMTNPRLLILDEATEGLAPLVRKEIWDCLAELKRMGQTVIVIDKNIASLLRLADNHHIVEKGKVVWSGSSASLKAQPELLERYVGV